MLKNYTHLFLSICFAIFSFGNSAITQKTYSLEDCINIALQNNIQTKQQSLQTENSKIDLLSYIDKSEKTLNNNEIYKWKI